MTIHIKINFRKVAAIAIAVVTVVGLLWAVDAIAAPYPPALGGTGTSQIPASGTVPIGTGSGTYTPAYLLCSGNCSVSSASGTITISVPPQTTSTVTIYPVSAATNTFSIVGDGSYVTVTNPATSTIKVSLSTAQVLQLISAASPLGYNSSTGQLSCASCLTSLNGALLVTNNLSDVASTTVARNSLGLGSIATYSKTDYLTSSTVYVSTVNGSSGAVTITSSSLGVVPFSTTSINGTASLSFHIVGDGTTITSTVSGATTTLSVIAGAYLTPASGTALFYPLTGNPAGFTTTTIQAALNALSAAGCLTYSTSTGVFTATCLTTSTAATTYVPYTGATGNVNLGVNALTDGSTTVTGNLYGNGTTLLGTVGSIGTFTTTTTYQGNPFPLEVWAPTASMPTSTTLATATPALILARNGLAASAYSNYAFFNLSRYATGTTNANTELTIALASGNTDAGFTPTNVLSLQAGGNVGVGTTVPVNSLDVNGSADVQSRLAVGLTATTSNSGAALIVNDAVPSQIQAGTSIPFYLMSSQPTLGFNMYYNSGWKYGDGSVSGTNYGAELGFDTRNSVSAFNLGIASGTGNAGAAVTLYYPFQILQDGEVGIGGFPATSANLTGSALYISASSNVGIGTLAPKNKLDVNGSADVQTNLAVGTTTTSTATLNVNGTINGNGTTTFQHSNASGSWNYSLVNDGNYLEVNTSGSIPGTAPVPYNIILQNCPPVSTTSTAVTSSSWECALSQAENFPDGSRSFVDWDTEYYPTGTNPNVASGWFDNARGTSSILFPYVLSWNDGSLNHVGFTESPAVATSASKLNANFNLGTNGQFSVGTAATSTGAFVVNQNGANTCAGIYDSGAAVIYGIADSLPLPSGCIGLGGYYHGIAVGGSTANAGSPIFGVLNSSQSSNGKGHTAFTVYDTNEVDTFNNTLDDGNGNATVSSTLNVGGSLNVTSTAAFNGTTTFKNTAPSTGVTHVIVQAGAGDVLGVTPDLDFLNNSGVEEAYIRALDGAIFGQTVGTTDNSTAAIVDNLSALNGVALNASGGLSFNAGSNWWSNSTTPDVTLKRIGSRELGITNAVNSNTQANLAVGRLAVGTTTTSVADFYVVSSTVTSTIAVGNPGIGHLCLWNGANWTIQSFASGSITPVYATSTTCN